MTADRGQTCGGPLPGVSIIIVIAVGLLVFDSVTTAIDPTTASFGILPTLGDLLAGGLASALGGVLVADGVMLALQRTRLPLEGP